MNKALYTTKAHIAPPPQNGSFVLVEHPAPRTRDRRLGFGVLMVLLLTYLILFSFTPTADAATLSTLRPIGDGTQTTMTFSSGTAGWSLVDDDPDSPDTADYYGYSGNTDGTYTSFLLLTDMPADFDTMTTLDIKAYVTNSSGGNDTIILTAQIFESNETSALTNEVTLSTDTDATGLKSGSFSLTGNNNKTVWDGARIRFSWAYDRVQGSDVNYIRLAATELNGTYSALLPLTLSGTLYSDEGVTQLTSKTIKAAIGTSTLSLHSTTTNSGSGAWSLTIPAGHTIRPSTPITLWVDGATEKATLFTKASSTENNISGLNLYQNRVIIRHEGTSGTSSTNANMAFYDGDDDSDIQYTSNSGALSIRAGNELHVWTGKTYAPGGPVTIHGNAGSGLDGSFHLPASATFTAGGTTTIAGNFSASSTASFTGHASGTIFNATTTGKTIDTSLTSWSPTFNGAGGGWTFPNGASTTNLTVTAGTVAITGTGYIQGNLTNAGTLTATNLNLYGNLTNSGSLTVTGTTTMYTDDTTITGTAAPSLGNVVLRGGLYPFADGGATTTNPSSSYDSARAIWGDTDTLYIAGYRTCTAGQPCGADTSGTHAYYIIAYNKTDGSYKWATTTNPSSSSDYANATWGDADTLYVAGYRACTATTPCGADTSNTTAYYTIAYNKSDGSFRWATTTNPSSSSDSANATWGDADTLYVAGYRSCTPSIPCDADISNSYALYTIAYNKTDGSYRWATTTNPSSAFDYAYATWGDTDTLYVAGSRGCNASTPCDADTSGSALYTIAYNKSDGSFRWATTTNPSDSSDYAYATWGDTDTLYVAGSRRCTATTPCGADTSNTEAYYTIAYNKTDGSYRWATTTNPSSSSDDARATWGDTDTLYVTGSRTCTATTTCGADSSDTTALYTIAYNKTDGSYRWATTTNPSSASDYANATWGDSDTLYVAGFRNCTPTTPCGADTSSTYALYTIALDLLTGDIRSTTTNSYTFSGNASTTNLTIGHTATSTNTALTGPTSLTIAGNYTNNGTFTEPTTIISSVPGTFVSCGSICEGFLMGIDNFGVVKTNNEQSSSYVELVYSAFDFPNPGIPISGISVAILGKTTIFPLDSGVAVSLSWDDGNSYSEVRDSSSLSGADEPTEEILGSETDLWAHSWTTAELDNLRVKIAGSNVIPFSTQGFEIIDLEVRVHFVSDSNLYFSSSNPQQISGPNSGTDLTAFSTTTFIGSGVKTFATNATTSNFAITAGATVVAPDVLTIEDGNYYNSGTFTAGTGTTTFSGTSAQTATGTMMGTSAFNNVAFTGSGTKTFGANASSSNFTIASGVTIVASSPLSLSGNYTNNGTFTPGTGTTTFSGTTAQTATGTLNFYNLDIINTSATTTLGASTTVANNLRLAPNTTVAFASGATTTATYANLVGTAGNTIKLRPTTPGTPWYFAVTGDYTIDYVDVKDSTACGSVGGGITTTANSVNSTGNTCWSFGGVEAGDTLTISGVLYESDRVTPVAASQALVLAVATSTVSLHTTNTTVTTGAFTFTIDVGEIATATPLTVYVDGNASLYAVTVTKAASTTATANVANLHLYQNHVAIKNEAPTTTGTSTTIADLARYDSSDDADIQFTATEHSLTLGAGQSLYVSGTSTFLSGSTTVPGNVLTATTSTLIASTSLTVAGNFHNAGTYTTAGAVWTDRNVTSAKSWRSVTYGNGLFVAVNWSGSATAAVMTSPDGITWTDRNVTSVRAWQSVTYGNGLFVAVNSSGSATTAVMTSPDGITWTDRNVPSAKAWYSVTYGNGLFVAVNGSNSATAAVMTSPDGITWTDRNVTSARAWQSVTYGNGLFVAVNDNGSATAAVMTSPDGITWTDRNVTSAKVWTSVTYGNGLFVAVNSSGSATAAVMTSPDGITWTDRNVTSAKQWTSVTYGNGLFVAVNQSNSATAAVMTSPDGITWTDRNVPSAKLWGSVTYGNGLFVAVNWSGSATAAVMTSAVSTTTFNGASAQSIGGSLTGASALGNVAMTGAGTKTFSANASTTNFVVNTGATAVAPATALTIHGNYTNSGTFTAGANTIFAGSVPQHATGTLTGTSALNTVTFRDNGTKLIGAPASTTNFTIASDSNIVTAPSTTLAISGNYTNSATSSFNANSGTTTFTGGSAQTIAGFMVASSTFAKVSFTGAGTKTFNNAASTTNFDINTGATVVAPATTLSITGNYQNNGTFTHNSGTVVLASTTKDQSLAGTMTGTSAFNHLTLSGASTKLFYNSASTSNLTILTGATVTPQGTLTVAGNFLNNGGFYNPQGTLALDANSAQSLSGNLTHTSALGNVLLTGGNTKTFANNASTTNLTIAAGTTVTAPTVLSVGSTYTNAGTFGAGAGTLYLAGARTTATGTLTGTSALNDVTVTGPAPFGTQGATTTNPSSSSDVATDTWGDSDTLYVAGYRACTATTPCGADTSGSALYTIAYNKTDGSYRWATTTNPSSSSDAANATWGDSDTLYVAGSRRCTLTTPCGADTSNTEAYYTIAYNKTDGSYRWATTTNPSSSFDDIQGTWGDTDTLYVAGLRTCTATEPCGADTANYALYTIAYNKADGTLRWATTTNPSSSTDQARATWGDTDTLYVAGQRTCTASQPCGADTTSSALYTIAYNKSDGSYRWATTTNPSSSSDNARATWGDSDTLYVAGLRACTAGQPCSADTTSSALYTIAYNKSDGSYRWATTTNPSSSTDYASATWGDGDTLYVAGQRTCTASQPCGADTTSSALYTIAYNKPDGSYKWATTTNPSSASDSAATTWVDQDTLYVAGNRTCTASQPCGADTAAGAYYTIAYNKQDGTARDGYNRATVGAPATVADLTIVSGNGSATNTLALTNNLSVTGNYQNGGAFEAGGGTTTFNGTSAQSIGGSLVGASTFGNLALTGAGVKTFSSAASTTNLTIGTTATTSFNGAVSGEVLTITTPAAKVALAASATSTFDTVTIAGTSGNEVRLRSSTPGTQAALYLTGAYDISYIDVKDSHGSSTLNGPLNATYSTSTGNVTGWNFVTLSASDATIASGAHQTFALSYPATAISPITVTDAESPSITAASDLRITIATSSVAMVWDTTDTTGSFSGTAADKVSTTVSYEGNGSILVIDVTENFAASDTLTVSGLAFTNFTAINVATTALAVDTDGAASATSTAWDDKDVTITGSLTLDDHTEDQVDDNFQFPSDNQVELYRYTLTPTGEDMTITSTIFSLTGVNGVNQDDLSNLVLYKDNNTDGLLDGGDTAVGGAGVLVIDGQSGTITFSTSYTLTATTDFLLIGAVTQIRPGDMLTVSLPKAGIITTGDVSLGTIPPVGSISSIQHIRGGLGRSSGGYSLAPIGGDAPPGTIETGGGQDGGSEIDTNTNGDTLTDLPNFRAPSAQGGGWTGGLNGINSDGSYAGTSAGGIRHIFSNFDFAVPSSNQITGIEVKLEASATTNAGTISAQLSWNADTSYTSAQTTPTLTTSDTVYTLGGQSDNWGHSWTPGETTNGNFVLRVTGNPNGNTVQIDAIRVRVYHQSTGGGQGGGVEVRRPGLLPFAGTTFTEYLIPTETALRAELISALLDLQTIIETIQNNVSEKLK